MKNNKRIYDISLVIGLFCLGLLGAWIGAGSNQQPLREVKTREDQEAITPKMALEKLLKGNERFAAGAMRPRDFIAQAASSKKRQFPFALVYSCMDSRGGPEIILDQGIGDIFVERLAGNVVNNDLIGGMEYATQVIGAKLILVLGHSGCGAVKGACEGDKLGHLTLLLEKIRPAITSIEQEEGSPLNCQNKHIVNKISAQNIRNVVKQIRRESPILEALIKEGKLAIVGGMHHLAKGKIEIIANEGLSEEK